MQAKAALDLSRRVRDLVQQRFEAGAVAQLEVLQADVELARSTADYETTAQLERSADVTLAALLNRSIDGTISIEGRLEEVPSAGSLETLTNQAMRSNADLQKSAQDLKTEERRLELAKTQRIPNLDLSVGADFNSPPDFQTGAKGGSRSIDTDFQSWPGRGRIVIGADGAAAAYNCVTANKRIGAGGVGILRLRLRRRDKRSNIVNQLSRRRLGWSRWLKKVIKPGKPTCSRSSIHNAG